MFKKFLSVLLAVMMVVSAMVVGVVTGSAATTEGFTGEANKFYFDVDGTGWTMTSKDKVAFYMAGGDFDTEANATDPLAWGNKYLIGKATEGESGIWEIDPFSLSDKNGVKYTLTPGVQYKIIFVRVNVKSWKDQTCSVFFTTDCLGHVAYSDGTMMENDVDSSKTSLAAYWKGIDPAENGPALCITSLGNVVGSCVEQGKTKYDLFVSFISEEKDDFNGKTGLQNARYYTVEQAKTKTEQKMIDDIGAALDLTKNDVAKAFADTGVETAWSADASTLPAACDHVAGDPVKENEKPATCTAKGSYESVVYCSNCGTEMSRETVITDEIPHTLKHVDKVEPQGTTAGMEEHYECEVCHKLFTDEEGKHEVQAANLVIDPEIIRGDADCNGKLGITDATTIQKVLAELPVESYNEVAADADKDTTVDIIDVTLIQRVLAHITTFEKWDERHKKA